MTGPAVIPDPDAVALRRTFWLAAGAVERGQRPFGAVVVAADGTTIAEAWNTVLATGDVTAHAETNAVRQATTVATPDVLAEATIYSSAEPCAMCAGAIFWSGIGRVVYGLPDDEMRRIIPGDDPVLTVPSRAVLTTGHARSVTVIGPALVDEARQVHVPGHA